MVKTEDLLQKIERRHENILERLDELDRKIAETLENWSNPAAILSPYSENGTESAPHEK